MINFNKAKGNKEILKNICTNAEKLLNKNEDLDTHPIYLFIKSLVDLEYNKQICNTLSKYEKTQDRVIRFYDLFPCVQYKYGGYLYKKGGKPITFSDLMLQKEVSFTETISLGYDPVFACPWDPERLTNCMNFIKGSWKQDINHDITLLMPYGITFVNSGNHSITVGYLKNVGELEINKIFNISEIHDYIYTDGTFYYRKEDNSICAKVENFNFAVIFAIGELIHNSSDKNIKIKFHGKDVNDFG